MRKFLGELYVIGAIFGTFSGWMKNFVDAPGKPVIQGFVGPIIDGVLWPIRLVAGKS